MDNGRAWFVPETNISNPDITSYSKSNNPGGIQKNNQILVPQNEKRLQPQHLVNIHFLLIIHQYCILLNMIHRKRVQPFLLTISKMAQEVQFLSEQF